MKIVLISGRKRSGKDSIAKALVEHLGAQRIALADALKDYVAAATGIPRELFEDKYKGQSLHDLWGAQNDMSPAWRLTEISPRQLLQGFGTKARDLFGADFWIDQFWRSIDQRVGDENGYLHVQWRSAKPHLIVVPDVRFFNELELCADVDVDYLRLRTNRADRKGRHDFAGDDDNFCSWVGDSAIPCGLPPESHPTHDSGDYHPSEVTLPDSGSCYDHVIEASSGEGAAQQGLNLVKRWLEKSR